MFVASHRTLITIALVLGLLMAVEGCAKRAARKQAPAPPVAVADDPPATAVPTADPTTQQLADATTQGTDDTQTSDPTTQATPPAEPATQTADPTTQPADPIAGTQSATAPIADATTQPAVVAPATRKADVPNRALAERFALMAQAPLRAPVVVDASWRTAAGVLEAATRLQPDEPRFVRLLAEARTRAGDVPEAIEALSIYRRLVPNDQFAQVQQIDLYLARMETADAKVAYLESLIAAEDVIAPPVRSHAAVRAAQTMLERSQPQQAESMLARALELNPLNIDALRTRVTTMPADAPAEARVAAIVSMIRATPADPGVSAALARELAAAGMHRAALPWFTSALQMYGRTGASPDQQLVTQYVASLLRNGDVNDAEAVLKQVLATDPSNLDAWLLRLLIARSSGDAAKFDDTRRQASVAMANRLAIIRQAAGDKSATTRPIDSPGEPELPAPGPLMQQLSATGRNEVMQAFAETAAAVAWQKIYFEQKPAEAVPWVGVLRTMLGEQNPLVTRLEGWSFLGVDRPDEARVKLSAVAESDPLAELGLIKIADPGAKDATDADARRLLAANPSGVMGVLLADALRERNIKLEPTADAQAIANELDRFPKDFLRILDQPGLFYTVRLDPVQIGHAFGEPILIGVSLQNIGTDALTIASNGAIRPDLWFDAQTRGIAQQPFVGVAYDRIAGPLVLQPGESTRQIVRLDQGQLHNFLEVNPVPTLQLSCSVTTNPTTGREGIAPGPAGLHAPLRQLMQRAGTPLTEPARQKIVQALASGSPAEKVRTLGLVATFSRGLSTEEADASSKAVAEQFRDLIRRATNDTDPNVRAWAGYMSVVAAPEAERRPLVEKLLAGDWVQRMFALMLVQSGTMPKEIAERVAASNEDPLLREYAAAVLELIAVAATQPAATQPAATQPAATQPATASAPRPAP